MNDAKAIRIREASPDDLPFLKEMLYEAANWRPAARGEISISRPEIAKYVRDWGTRAGDYGLLAEDEGGSAVGAVWYRLLPAEDPGFGYIDEDIPELTVAVETGSRGRGVGRALLAEVIDHAARVGLRALSLSVEEDNPALALYVSCGFERVRKVDNAWTMRRVLAKGSPGRHRSDDRDPPTSPGEYPEESE